MDRYLSVRRQLKATEPSILLVKANPSAYKGRSIELRGTLSGISRGGEQTLYILDANEGCFILSAEDIPELNPGARICVVAAIGERSVTSLSDLRLVAYAYESEVVAREKKAIEAAEQAKRAKEEAAAKAEQAKQAARNKEQNKPVAQPATSEELVAAYRTAVQRFNKQLSTKEADTIARSVLGFSAKYQVDPRLVVAVIIAESNFNPNATSKKGAMGLGQLMPGTASGLGVTNAYDPVQNIAGSVKLIRGHLDRLSGGADWTELTWNHLALALASYNAGPGAVKKHCGVPPYKETRTYIDKVIMIYKELCGVK